MNDQLAAQIRQLLTTLGAIAGTLGLAPQSVIDAKLSIALALVGPLMVVGSIGWSIFANLKSSIIKSASKMPEVKAMTISDPDLASAAKASDPTTRITTTTENK